MSEAEFVTWFIQQNPSGSGPAAFVDIISIWLFGATDSVNTSAFLTDLHCAKNAGFKGGSAEVCYTHSVTTQYPSVFVGKDKSPILSTTTIKMLESYEAWRGNGTGNEYRERLTDMLQITVQNHQQYCEDYLPDGDLKSMALKTADISKSFWMSLVAYLDDEYSLLESFKLVAKHVLLLLSNQIVRICDDIFEYRSNASNVDQGNMGAVAARFAWVSFQAIGCMNGYLKGKFRHHQAINSTFVRFLTRHMADQSALGLKSTVDALNSEVKAIKTECAKKVSETVFNKLDSKVTQLIRLNNLTLNEEGQKK